MRTSYVSYSLESEFPILIKEFERILHKRQEELAGAECKKEAVTQAFTQTVANIYNETDDDLKKYREIIRWCESLAADDVIRIEFIAFNETFFKEFKLKSKQQLDEKLIPIVEQNKNIPTESFRIVSQLEKTKKVLDKDLENLCEKVFDFESILQPEVPENKAHFEKLFDEILKIVDSEKLTVVEEEKFETTNIVANSSPVNLLNERKQNFLNELDQKVLVYRKKLRSSNTIINFFLQCFMFFSFARKRRKAALAEYTNTVRAKPEDIQASYAAATSWLDKQLNSKEFKNKRISSRFYSGCVLSMREGRKLIEFESIGDPVVKSQQIIDAEIIKQNNLLSAHESKVDGLNEILNKLTENFNTLQRKLNDFVRDIENYRKSKKSSISADDKDENTNYFLVVYFYKDIRKKIQGISKANGDVIKTMPALNTKNLILHLKNRMDEITEQEENLLRQNFVIFKNNPKILGIIDKEIADLIENIRSFGAMKKAGYLSDFNLAQRNLLILGLDKNQQILFDEAKRLVEKNKPQLLRREEEQLMSKFVKSIEKGTFLEMLANWAEVLKHCKAIKKVNGVPDPEKDKTNKEIQGCRSTIEAYYQNGGMFVKPFFEKIMQDSLSNTSKSPVSNQKNSATLTKADLTSEQIEVFVKVFGSHEDIQKFKLKREEKQNQSQSGLAKKSLFSSSPTKLVLQGKISQEVTQNPVSKSALQVKTSQGATQSPVSKTDLQAKPLQGIIQSQVSNTTMLFNNSQETTQSSTPKLQKPASWLNKVFKK